MFFFRRCFSILVFCLTASSIAGNPRNDETPKILRAVLENDLPLWSDREYTNGVLFEYGTYKKFPSPNSYLLAPLADRFSPKQEYHSLSLQHSIYTPDFVYTSDTPYGERPYSSYALVKSSSTYFFAKSSLGLSIGIGQIGPSTQGKEIQGIIHDTTQSPTSLGWNRQVPNQNLFQIQVQHRYFWTPSLGIGTHANLGNLDLSAGFGPILRFGKIQSTTGAGYQTKEIFAMENRDEELYFYISMFANYQSTNLTLGNPNAKKPYFGNLCQAGFVDGNLDERFFVFAQSLHPEIPISFQYLLFNSIFNGARVPSDSFLLYLIQEYQENPILWSRYPGIEFFIWQAAFRKRDEAISEPARLLAFLYLLESERNNEDLSLMALFLIENDRRAKEGYQVPIQKWQGRFSSGIYFQNKDYFATIGIEITSLEYKPRGEVDTYHRYVSLQVGKKF